MQPHFSCLYRHHSVNFATIQSQMRWYDVRGACMAHSHRRMGHGQGCSPNLLVHFLSRLECDSCLFVYVCPMADCALQSQCKGIVINIHTNILFRFLFALYFLSHVYVAACGLDVNCNDECSANFPTIVVEFSLRPNSMPDDTSHTGFFFCI